MDRHLNTLASLASSLDEGSIRSRDLVEAALARIEDPRGEGGRAFLSVSPERARAESDLIDRRRANGERVGRFAGIPLGAKDLFDIAGEITSAGSVVLADSPAASFDAPVMARLRDAGFIVMGRTNMTEFAFSGLGINPHFDAPRSPWARAEGRIPGGSSSGSAVAVADEMSVVALGTDTGGSCRIPAAFCGIVGFKPTARRVPLEGTFPLSPSLDSVGPIARTVQCCAIVDDILVGGDATSVPAGVAMGGVRLAALSDYVLEQLEPCVATAYGAALSALASAGAEVVEVPFPELLKLPEINATGGLAPYEAYQVHRDLLAGGGHLYDPLVRVRIELGNAMSSDEHAEVARSRTEMIEVAQRRLDGFDAFVLPSVAITPPTFTAFADGGDDYYAQTNGLCLRHTSVANFLDTCSISIPLAPVGEQPVGLMLMGRPMGDVDLLRVAQTIEAQIVRGW